MTDANSTICCTTGTDSTTIVDGVQTWPPLPDGCACGVVMDFGGCVPVYEMPGVGTVVPVAAYYEARERSLRWRIYRWWKEYKPGGLLRG